MSNLMLVESRRESVWPADSRLYYGKWVVHGVPGLSWMRIYGAVCGSDEAAQNDAQCMGLKSLSAYIGRL